MIIKRDILKVLEGFLDKREYLAVVGPRQSGKTVLFGMINSMLSTRGRKTAYVTFEDRMALKQFSAAPVEFIRSLIDEKVRPSYILIDEFQYVKNGGSGLKLIYDTMPDLKILVTGSSSLDIRTQAGKYMVGRMLTFNLYPFNFGEFLLANDVRLRRLYEHGSQILRDFLLTGRKAEIKQDEDPFFCEISAKFSEYAVWGGYPAVVLEKNRDKKIKILTEIQNNYILKDIKGLLALATDERLMSLAEFLSAQAGGIINYNNLSSLTGIDFRALKKYIKILEETFICCTVRPFFTSKIKELSKAPKIYFIDNGFRNSLIDDMRPAEKRQDMGALIENYVYRRLLEITEGIHPIYYWRTKAGAEVDFVVKADGQEIPIEVKYSMFKENTLTRSYVNFIENFKPERGLVLTKNYWGIKRIKNTRVLFAPVYYL
ncbi:MAG: ATP-binding protein [Candidatus Goldbacteria bacterium]|nr:ATP-binding protein [Candidatus Goldiibacteriota bacterium]HPD18187.1 ATP-binding protein [Candidatus Goldiibacteriota bacterium]